jgi:hypothetical protein
VIAYYCFVNHGWTPSTYAELPDREKVLVALFIKKEAEEREKLKKHG